MTHNQHLVWKKTERRCRKKHIIRSEASVEVIRISWSLRHFLHMGVLMVIACRKSEVMRPQRT